jgi:pyruvate kinase
MSRSGVEAASAINAKVIAVPTLSGNTARILSVFRPDEPILALTPDEHAERIMQLYWGVRTTIRPLFDESESVIQNAMKAVTDSGMAGLSDKILLLAGLPLNSPNMLNTIRVLIIGTVLARSSAGGHADPGITRVQGKTIHAATAKEALERIKDYEGKILVCKELTDDFIPVLRIVKGVICESISEISGAKLREINPHLVWLNNMRHVMKKLEQGLTVTLDTEHLLVYEGSIEKAVRLPKSTASSGPISSPSTWKQLSSCPWKLKAQYDRTWASILLLRR